LLSHHTNIEANIDVRCSPLDVISADSFSD
jgi:hypothetical protein